MLTGDSVAPELEEWGSSQDIEVLPLEPWGTDDWCGPAPAAIYVLRRRYLRPEQQVVDTFHELVGAWESEALMIASPTQAAMHPAYQKIIGLGLQAVPLLLNELKRTRRSWFWALAAITHENPAAGIKRAGDAVEAWLAWGVERGYLDA